MVNSNDLIGTIRFADKVKSDQIQVIWDNRIILVNIIFYMSLILMRAPIMGECIEYSKLKTWSVTL